MTHCVKQPGMKLTELRRMNDMLKRELGEMYVDNKELKKTLNGLESEES